MGARFGHSDAGLDALARSARRCDKGRATRGGREELPIAWRPIALRRVAGAALLLLCAAAAVAQDSAPAPPASADESDRLDAIDRELRRETERQHQLFGLARARLSYPMVASVGLGMLIGERSKAYDCTIQCEVDGWLASVEAGAGGVVWSLGPAYLIAELGDNKYFLSRRYMGYSVRGSVMRTWGETAYRPDREWHAGVEGQFTVVSLNLTLGVYRRIGHHGSGEPWLVSGGIGWGF
jgi:hypothetical protein